MGDHDVIGGKDASSTAEQLPAIHYQPSVLEARLDTGPRNSDFENGGPKQESGYEGTGLQSPGSQGGRKTLFLRLPETEHLWEDTEVLCALKHHDWRVGATARGSWKGKGNPIDSAQ